MNVLLIPKMGSYFDSSFPNSSAATILACIKDPVEVIDLNFDSTGSALVKISQINPLYIFITCMVDSYENAILISERLKKLYPNVRIAIGGPHITLMTLSKGKLSNYFDDICVGEAEAIVSKIFSIDDNSSYYSRIQKIWLDKNGQPFLSRKKWKFLIPNWGKLLRSEHLPILMIEGSRGCPFHCGFCSHSDLSGDKFRMKSKKNILKEVSLAYHNYVISHFRFTDSNLTHPKTRFEELCYSLKNFRSHVNSKLSWVCFSRLTDLNPTIISKAADAGCIGMFLGIESHREAFLKTIKKNYNRQVAKETIKTAKEKGILLFGNYIFGLPGDKSEDWELMVDDILDLRLPSVNVNPFYLAPYSSFARNAESFGIKILSKNWIDNFHKIFKSGDTYFKTSTLTQLEMKNEINKIRNCILEEGILWNLKDYHLLAWNSIGGSFKSISRIWNQPEKTLSGNDLQSFLEMRKRGDGMLPTGFEKQFKESLIHARNKAETEMK